MLRVASARPATPATGHGQASTSRCSPSARSRSSRPSRPGPAPSRWPASWASPRRPSTTISTPSTAARHPEPDPRGAVRRAPGHHRARLDAAAGRLGAPAAGADRVSVNFTFPAGNVAPTTATPLAGGSDPRPRPGRAVVEPTQRSTGGQRCSACARPSPSPPCSPWCCWPPWLWGWPPPCWPSVPLVAGGLMAGGAALGAWAGWKAGLARRPRPAVATVAARPRRRR